MEGKSEEKVDRDVIIAEVFEAISHPTRICILKLLEEKPRRFSEIKHKLGITSSGNINHHLKKLSILIDTDSRGDYILTDQGHEALYMIKIAEQAKETRKYTLFIIIISLLIFYSMCMTIFLFSGKFDLNTLLFGVGLIILFPIVFRYTYAYAQSNFDKN